MAAMWIEFRDMETGRILRTLMIPNSELRGLWGPEPDRRQDAFLQRVGTAATAAAQDLRSRVD